MIDLLFPEDEMLPSLHALRWMLVAVAQECDDDEITPDHLFLAICSFPDERSCDRYELPPEEKDWLLQRDFEMAAASATIERVFAEARLERLRIRAAISQQVPKPGRIPPVNEDDEQIYHRTAESKALFDRADELAQGRATPIHILAALLENETGVWATALMTYESLHAQPGALKAAVRALLTP